MVLASQQTDSISVVCACGGKFRAPAALAGTRVKCPKCGQPLAVSTAGTSRDRPPVVCPTANLPPLNDDPLGLGGLDVSAGSVFPAACSHPSFGPPTFGTNPGFGRPAAPLSWPASPAPASPYPAAKRRRKSAKKPLVIAGCTLVAVFVIPVVVVAALAVVNAVMAARDASKEKLDDVTQSVELMNQGIAAQKQQDYATAVDCYERGIPLDPEYDDTSRYLLGWIMATCPDPRYRNGPRAVELMIEARRIEHTKSESTHSVRQMHLAGLAAAHAEAGNFPEAIRVQTDVLGDPSLSPGRRAVLEQRLAMYQANQPWRTAELK